MIRRYLETVILESLRHFPWKANYLTLDDRTTLDAALRDPDGLIGGMPTPAVIDEVQKAPDLMRAIKREVDRHRSPGRYLLTGSANILALA
jgi:uncharacterized protein